MHARKADCLLQCRQGSRAHEPGLDIVDGSLESSVPPTARYQQVSPQQACREGTSGGNFSSRLRKHLSNEPLAGNWIPTPGSQYNQALTPLCSELLPYSSAGI